MCSILAKVCMDVCVSLCCFCSFLRLHLLFKGENYCLKDSIRKLFFGYIHKFSGSCHTSVSQIIPTGESKILCLYYIFITWFCGADSVRQSERKEDKKTESVKNVLCKKSGAIWTLSSLCSLGLCGSCPTLRLRNMHFPIQVHISMLYSRNTLLPSPASQHQGVWGWEVHKREGSSGTLSQISRLETLMT